MKVSPQVILENESRLAFRSFLPKAWIVRDKTPDYGIDMEVEIVEEGQLTEKIFWVQLKATENIEVTSEVIKYSMETKHLKHFENCRTPVVIILWIKQANAFYYRFAQKYIREKICETKPFWRKQMKYSIDFSQDSRILSSAVLDSVATDGYFYIIEHQMSVRLESKTTVWLDGIPASQDMELKELTLKSVNYMNAERYFEAKIEFERILTLCTVTITEKAAILLNLGMACWMLGESEKALMTYNLILKLLPRIKKEKKMDAFLGKAHVLGDIGIIYSSRGDFDGALKYHKAALRFFKKSGNVKGEGDQLGNIGIVYMNKGDLNKAFEYLEKARAIHKMAGFGIDEVIDMNNIGRIYSLKGDPVSALECHRNAMDAARANGYKEGEANQLCNIGIIHLEEGDLTYALRYLKKALKIHKEIRFLRGEAADLTNIGLIYRINGETSKALYYMNKALRIHKEIKYPEGEANQLANIGFIYLDKGHFDYAFKFLTAALDIMNEHQITHGRDKIQRALYKVRFNSDF